MRPASVAEAAAIKSAALRRYSSSFWVAKPIQVFKLHTRCEYRDMDGYEELRYLGRGSYAVVKLVRRKVDGELLVIKKFHTPLSELSPKERNEIAQEIRLLAHLRHPNIISFKNNFIEGGTVHIVMEYATGGTLSKRILDRSGELFAEDTIWEILAQLVLALRYISSCHLLHRDLKTDNVLLSGPDSRIVKLSDFGIAKVRHGGAASLRAHGPRGAGAGCARPLAA